MTLYIENPSAKPVSPVAKGLGLTHLATGRTHRSTGLRVKTHIKAGPIVDYFRTAG